MNSALHTNSYAPLALAATLALASCGEPVDDTRCQIERRADPARVVRVQGDCSQQDFSGVDLTGADLRGVTWGDGATCPDGSRSGDHGGSCLGHLDPDGSPPDLGEDTGDDLQEPDIIQDIPQDVAPDGELDARPDDDLGDTPAPPDLTAPDLDPADSDPDQPCAQNACGGCGALVGEPGALCGPCNTGTWRCDGDGVVCQDIPACASRACQEHLDCRDRGDLCVDGFCTPDGATLVPAGVYLRGSPEEEAGRGLDEVRQEVTLTRPLFVSLYEYAHSDWDRDRQEPLAPFERVGCTDRECPITSLSWFQALSVANQASRRAGLTQCYTDTDGNGLAILDPFEAPNVRWPEGYDCEGWRLPTDAEWEYFARAGTSTPWSSGGDPDALAAFAWSGEDGGSPHPVGEKRPNPWGLYDVHGNVAEYVWDSFLAIPEGEDTDPLSPPPGARYLTIIARGGHHASHYEEIRSAARLQYSPYINVNQNRPRVGLRLVRTVTPQP